MREIKFRAWDGHKMQYNFTIDSEDGMPRLIQYCIHGEPTDPVPQFKLMQFTGLKDKNGKDIYEGDILDFDEKEWGGVFKLEAVPSIEKLIGDWPMCGSLSDLCLHRKVVGNIYENPELLK